MIKEEIRIIICAKMLNRYMQSYYYLYYINYYICNEYNLCKIKEKIESSKKNEHYFGTIIKTKKGIVAT